MMIRLENISKFYRGKENVSVGIQKITTEFKIGDFVAITGESGSGKSTLLNVLSGLDNYDDGELYIGGEETSHYNDSDWEQYRLNYISFVFQDYNIIDSYTVFQNVILALELNNYPKALRKKRALELIERVGLTSHKNHKSTKLSGGQKQRVVIARALAKDAPIIVADEPTGNLDSESSIEIIDLLASISQDKLVIIVTHDFNEVAEKATRKIRMHDGRIIEDRKFIINEKNTLVNVNPTKTRRGDLVKLASRNMFATPKRLIFVVLLQCFVVAIILFLYGTLLSQYQSISDGSIGLYGRHSLMTDNHIIVARNDQKKFDDTEISEYYNNSDVIEVLTFSLPLMDSKNSSPSTKELAISDANLDVFSETLKIDHLTVLRRNNYKFSGGYSYYFDKLDDGTYDYSTTMGIVVSDSLGLKVGENVILNRFEETKFVISGIVQDSKRKAYMPDEYFSDYLFYFSQKEEQKQVPFEFTTKGYKTPIKISLSDIGYVSSGIEDDEVNINRTKIDLLTNNLNLPLNEFELKGFATDYSKSLTRKSVVHSSNELMILSENTYQDLLVETSSAYELVLVFKDAYTANKYYRTINSSEFMIYYHDNIENLALEAIKFVFSFFMYIILLIVGVVLISVIHFVTKNIMISRKKDFAVYRSLGSNKKDIGIIVIIEQVITTIISVIIILVAFNALSQFVPVIAMRLRYFGWIEYISLTLIMLLLAIYLANKYNRKIFNLSVVSALNVEE